jgi:cytochrome c peroxidase
MTTPILIFRLLLRLAYAGLVVGCAVLLVAPGVEAGGLERGEKARTAKRVKAVKAKLKEADRTPLPAADTAQTPDAVAPTRSLAIPSDPRIENLQEGARRAFDDLYRGATPRAAPPQLPSAGEAPAVEATPRSLAALKRLFARPQQPVARVAAEVELGGRLFFEKRLSSDHKMSCATCHDPDKAFIDGRPRARGNKGQTLPRNTPALLNLGDAKAFYWDGRAPTLEAQVKDAIEREGEMDATLEAAVVWLSRDQTYVDAFARAYPGQGLANETLPRAIAAYERTLVSPPTRFDRWVAGDEAALDAKEIAGFRVFTGKGRCLACHGGWRFTDDKFHDIGLRSPDRGRAALPGVASAERAFKTPSLREARWTAPYMHDGNLRSFDDVVAHYAGKLDRRASLAAELKQPIDLTPQERAQLVLFLKTLSSDTRPRAP